MSGEQLSLAARLKERRKQKAMQSGYGREIEKPKDLAKGEEAATQYMDAVEDNTLLSLDRTINCAANTVETGTDISDQLSNQREKIKNAHKNIHEAEQDLDQSKHKIKAIKSWGGMIGNWFRKAPEKKKYKGVSVKEPAKSESKEPVQEAYQVGDSDTKQEQIDGKLDNLNQYLGKLKIQAKDIGDEIDYQNNMLKSLDDNIDRVNNKMGDQNQDLNLILGK